MNATNPNRDRVRSSDRDELHQKKSGDQHNLPADEAAESPHRPHRVSREDMQKLLPAERNPDEPASR